MHGRVTLSSGREADYYVDLRRATLHHEAGPLIGRLVRELTADWTYDAAGGLTLGADPVALAVMHAPGRPVDACVVRSAAKTHGMQRRIEGPDVAGRRVLAVEDTSTTGGSVLTAVDALVETGAEVVGVVTVVDRGTGATEAVEARGLACRSLLGLADLGPADHPRRPGRARPHRVAHGPRAGRGGAVAGRARRVARRPPLRPGAARRGRPAQRRRPLPLLAPRGRRRRPRPAPPPVPRRDREPPPRREHRHDRAHGQRVRGGRGARRRAAALEPARRDGHRPLPARPPPRRRRGAARLGAGRGPGGGRRRQRAGGDAAGDRGAAAALRAAVRSGGRGADPGGGGGRRPGAGHRPVRLDALDQRRRRGGDRHARVDPRARGRSSGRCAGCR